MEICRTWGGDRDRGLYRRIHHGVRRRLDVGRRLRVFPEPVSAAPGTATLVDDRGSALQMDGTPADRDCDRTCRGRAGVSRDDKQRPATTLTLHRRLCRSYTDAVKV